MSALMEHQADPNTQDKEVTVQLPVPRSHEVLHIYFPIFVYLERGIIPVGMQCWCLAHCIVDPVKAAALGLMPSWDGVMDHLY